MPCHRVSDIRSHFALVYGASICYQGGKLLHYSTRWPPPFSQRTRSRITDNGHMCFAAASIGPTTRGMSPETVCKLWEDLLNDTIVANLQGARRCHR